MYGPAVRALLKRTHRRRPCARPLRWRAPGRADSPAPSAGMAARPAAAVPFQPVQALVQAPRTTNPDHAGAAGAEPALPTEAHHQRVAAAVRKLYNAMQAYNTAKAYKSVQREFFTWCAAGPGELVYGLKTSVDKKPCGSSTLLHNAPPPCATPTLLAPCLARTRTGTFRGRSV